MRVHTSTPRERHAAPASTGRRLLINGVMLATLAVGTMLIPCIYIPHEHTFYFWDGANFQNLTSAKAMAFRRSPFWAIYNVRGSIANNYNEIFTIPLLPFILLLGDTRLVFITAVAVVYLLPFTLVVGAIAARMIPSHPRVTFWSAATLALLTPAIWAPVLRGYPDVGGAALTALAIWFYLKDVQLRRWWQIVLIGIFTAAAVLFRRHFAYSAIAFFLSITGQALIESAVPLRQYPREAMTALLLRGIRIGFAGLASLAVLAGIGWGFIENVRSHDYSALYADYFRPYTVTIRYFGASYGWAFWSFAAAGLVIGIKRHLLDRPAAGFLLLFCGVSLIQWIFTVGQVNSQYPLHYAAGIVCGLTALGWFLWTRLRGALRIAALSAGLIAIVFNLVYALANVYVISHSPIHPLLSAVRPPRISANYDEITRLVRYLRSIASPEDPIYVAASSGRLNDSLLREADRVVDGRERSMLNVLLPPQIDSRDFYPLEPLLQAQYVVVGTPFQHHLDAEKQRVVKVVFAAFTEDWEISRDFRPLPERFLLSDGTAISLYRRVRETSFRTALRASRDMEQFIGKRPGGQLDWISLNQVFHVGKDQDATYSIRPRKAFRNRVPASSLLYVSKPPPQAEIRGAVTFHNPLCAGITLAVTAIDARDHVIDTRTLTLLTSSQSTFSLVAPSDRTAHLLLKISGLNRNGMIDQCPFKIDRLAVRAAGPVREQESSQR